MASLTPQPRQTRLRHWLAVLLPFYVVAGVTGILIFIALFKMNVLSSIHILFYRGIVLVMLASLVHLVLLLCGARLVSAHRPLPAPDMHVPVLLLGTLCFNLTFFLLVPLSLDRSISVFMLGYMQQQQGHAVSRQDMQDAFNRLYVERYDAVGRRLEEQLASGDIVETHEGYKLTSRGEAVVNVFKAVAATFGINPRFLAPEAAPASDVDNKVNF